MSAPKKSKPPLDEIDQNLGRVGPSVQMVVNAIGAQIKWILIGLIAALAVAGGLSILRFEEPKAPSTTTIQIQQ